MWWELGDRLLPSPPAPSMAGHVCMKEDNNSNNYKNKKGNICSGCGWAESFGLCRYSCRMLNLKMLKCNCSQSVHDVDLFKWNCRAKE